MVDGNNNNEIWEDNDVEAEAVHNIEAARDEDNEESEQNNNLPRNDDGTIDGGVAVEPDSTKTTVQECDLMLFLECVETIDGHESHPVLKPGVTVCIGMDKATKLGAVFQRYVDFVNEHRPPPPTLPANRNRTPRRISDLMLEELEFVHCCVLRKNDTAEAAALMKNDKIKVQRIRKDERELQKQSKQIQREADRNYFEHFRTLMSDLSGSCDVIFDCRGKLVDVDGLNQEVLRTTLRGHSAILCKRSKWLRELIKQARDDLERKSVITVPDVENSAKEFSKDDDLNKSMDSDDGDDGIEVLPYPAQVHHDPGYQGAAQIENDSGFQGAAQIENDDDEDHNGDTSAVNLVAESRAGSPIFASSSISNMLWVTIPNHPPQAVKLLLEYCLTNSVLSLGLEAFQASWKSDDSDDDIRRNYIHRWPDGRKYPFASFSTALAGISLAEEAGIPRLSLMCEVAAARLVESSNVVEALSICTKQEQLTGNPLKRLRMAAMKHVLNGKSLDSFLLTQSFSRALDEAPRSAMLVPSLFQGLGEAVAAIGKDKRGEVHSGKLRTLELKTQEKFREIDNEDMFQREMERRKYRSSSSSIHDFSMFLTENESWEFSNRSSSTKSSNGRRRIKRSVHPNRSSQSSKHNRYRQRNAKGNKFTIKKY